MPCLNVILIIIWLRTFWHLAHVQVASVMAILGIEHITVSVRCGDGNGRKMICRRVRWVVGYPDLYFQVIGIARCIIYIDFTIEPQMERPAIARDIEMEDIRIGIITGIGNN